MNELERLQIIIEAQTSKVNQEVAKVNKSFDNMNKSVSKAEKSIGKSLSFIKKAMIAAFSVRAVVQFGKGMMNAANDLLTLSSQTGIGVERLQELRFAAEQSGTSIESLKEGIKALSQQMDRGNPAVERLGITSQDTGEAFEQTLSALAKMPAGVERNAIGAQLLGESYVRLIPLLDQGEEGIKQLTQAARNSGAVMSKELVQGIDSLRQSLDRLKSMFVSAFYPIVEFVLPALNALVRALSYTVGFIAGIIKAIFGLKQASTDTSKKIENSNKKTIKSNAALKRSYAGFDELNVLSEPTAAGGSGADFDADFGGGIDDAATKALEDARNQAKAFNDAIAAGLKFWEDWGKLILIVVGAIAALVALNTAKTYIEGFINTGVGLGFLGKYITDSWVEAFMALREGGEATTALAKIFVTYMPSMKTILLGVSAAILLVIATIAALYQAFKENTKGINDVWDTTWTNIKSLFENIWNQIKPIVAMAVGMIMTIWEYGLKPVWDGFVNFVASVAILVMEIINFLMPLINFLVNVFGPIFQVVFAIAAVLFTGFAIGIGQAIAIVINVLGLLLDAISWIFRNGWDIIKWFIDFIKDVFVLSFSVQFGIIKTILDNWFTAAKNVFQNLKNVISGIATFISGVFKGDWKKAWEGIVQVVGNVFGGIVNIVKAPLNTIISLINNAIRGFNKIKIPSWVPGLGGRGINIPLIPKLARGGMVDAGQLFIAGEAGSELIGSHQGKQTVMPLENTSFVSAMAEATYAAIVRGILDSSTGDNQTIITVDGLTLAKAVETNLNKLSVAQGGLNLKF